MSRRIGAIILMLALVLACSARAEDAFNLELDVPETYRSIEAGHTLWFTIKVLNLQFTDRMDVTLAYSLSDKSGVNVSGGSKTVAVGTQAGFVTSMKIPEGTVPGKYTLNARLVSNSSEASSATEINVVPPGGYRYIWITTVILALVATPLIFGKRIKKALSVLLLKFRVARIVNSKLKKK